MDKIRCTCLRNQGVAELYATIRGRVQQVQPARRVRYRKWDRHKRHQETGKESRIEIEKDRTGRPPSNTSRYFAGEFFADVTLDAGALDFLLVGALLFVDVGLVEAGFVFADLGLAGAGFVPVASFFGVTFALEVFFAAGLALVTELLALAAFGLDVEAFFAGEAYRDAAT